PLVGREGGEVGGTARRQDAGADERVVLRADAELAKSAGEIHPGLVDLVAVIVLAFELDSRADLKAVVEHRRAGEVDFSVVEKAMGVPLGDERAVGTVV